MSNRLELSAEEGADTPWKVPDDTSTFVYLLRWPITLVLWLTLPDCRKHPRLKMITFFLCIAWIGITSYAVAMTITIIGETLSLFLVLEASQFTPFDLPSQETRSTFPTRSWA